MTKHIRAMLDANILISFLLAPDPERSAPAAVMQKAQAGAVSVVVPIETLEETARVAADKPWLAKRIAPGAAERLREVLGRLAEVAPRLEATAPSVTRDIGDDYLIAQAVLARVDFLVTRDRDLLSLSEVAGIQIVDPVTFLALLRATTQSS